MISQDFILVRVIITLYELNLQLPVAINKVSLEYSHSYLFIATFKPHLRLEQLEELAFSVGLQLAIIC